jgi:hypothetical protein
MVKEEKEEQKPALYRPIQILKNKIAEAVSVVGMANMWLIYDFKDQSFMTKPIFEDDRFRYCPVGKGMISYEPYTFTIGQIERLQAEKIKIPNLQVLYQKVYDEFGTFLDIEEEYKHLETAFCFETYQQHKMNSTGYLYHTGEHDSGKTRPLELQKYLAYRPLFGIKINEANVYEVIGTEHEGLCTILEDEAQELDDKNCKGKMAIYRSGYRTGQIVPRILEAGSVNRTMKFYYTFCCKAFSGYNFPKDEPFKSRCIEVPFVEGCPKKDEIEDEDKERWGKLKSMLLLWRMINYDKPLPKLNLPIRCRVKEVWKGKLMAVVGYDKAYQIMLDMAAKEQQKRYRSLHESLEAHMVKAVVYLEQNWGWGEIPFSEIWDWLMVSLNVPKLDKKVHKVYVDTLGKEVSKNLVGRKLDSALHGASSSKFKVGRMWQFKKDKMEALMKRYSLTEKDLKALERVNINE